MPELKHNFMKGRMNKDLDERLVANGEYRDALNVEVSTSEGANVGAVQTAMGNTNVGTGFGTCVASIADEKNNDIYWLVAGGSADGKDAILKYHKDPITNTFIVTPVLVDVWETTHVIAGQNGHSIVDDSTSHLHVSNLGNAVSNITNIRKGMLVTGTFVNNTGSTCNVLGNSIVNGGTYTLLASHGVVVERVKQDFPSNPGWRVYLTSTVGPTLYTLFPSTIGDSITFASLEKDRVLQFDPSRLITGLNVMDDLMFWTDNHSEPKKINITKCTEGTLDINTHSEFRIMDVNGDYISYNNPNSMSHEPILQEHITVIKKNPLIAPKLEMDDTETQRGNIRTTISTNFTNAAQDSNLVTHTQANPQIIMYNTSDMSILPDWREGDIVIATYDSQNITLFEKWEARLRLVDKDSTTGVWSFELIGITSEELDFVDVPWDFLLERTAALFEFKFPRFGYRYKYQDGEYSAFSPFSRVAFLPGPFDYKPEKGYNLGMKNQLRNLKIKDFIEENSIRPHGVVSIDILYKESNSPNIYTVKTINTDDPEWSAAGTNLSSLNTGLTRGSIAITSELIHAVVPSNQLLRPWDNVPRKALSQDISANRIIYGNYLQNYNLKDISNRVIKINTVIGVENSEPVSPNNPLPSIKSLRTYQLGLVYRDEFGRETPVLSSKAEGSGTVNLKKDVASKANKLTVSLGHSPPTFAHSFKFFVKETSNEYYNLAMDRWYNAEDGNVWISFPSSERSKIDEESYLILKKEHDADTPVDDEARYKVISISNDVPEYIKQSKKLYGTISNNITNTLFGDGGGGGIPEPKSKYLYVSKEAFDEQMGAAVTDALTSIEQFIKIKSANSTSHWYEVASLQGIELGNTGTKDTYKIELVEAFGEELQFTTTGNTGLFADITDGLKLQVAKQITKVKPEHRGRFFVKILKDGVLQASIMKAKNEDQSWVSVFSEPIYHINNPSTHQIPYSWGSGNQTPGGTGGTNNWGTLWAILLFDTQEATKNWWRNFGSHWFFDNARSRNNDSTLSASGDKLDNDGVTLAGNGGKTTGGITNASKKMHLSFSAVYAPGTSADPQATNAIDNHASGFPPLIDLGVDSNLDEKTWLDYITQDGTVFKFSKDPDGTMYVVEKTELFKSRCTKNLTHNIEDDLTNYDFNATNAFGGNSAEYRQTANKRVRYEITVGQWNGSGAKPTPLNPGLGIGVGTPENYDPISGSNGVLGANHYNNAHAIEILEIEDKEDEGDFSSTNPAIWETEPKEDVGLDLYYEASDANPIELNYKTNEIYIPVTSYLTLPGDRTWTANNAYPSSLIKVTAFNDDTISINDQPLDSTLPANGGPQPLQPGDTVTFTKPSGGMVTGTVVTYTAVGSLAATIKLSPNLHNQKYYLDWFNCYSFGNGVESNRIRDDFNAVMIDKGPKVSTTLATPYKEERKTNGLIYSGIYNSTSGVNNLNQFVMAEKITKDLSPRFGSIQKLHARDSDLVAFCEDKVVRLLANKDALYNADGNPQLIATDRVLGQTVPFAGEHGISKNPESFATQAYQSYFSDKSRGVIMRLSKGGLQPVSEHGMKDWFSDNLRHAQTIIGSYDDKKSLYNVTLKDKEDAVIEVVIPDSDISFANANTLGYFTFHEGGIFGQSNAITYGLVGDSSTSYTNYNGTNSYAYGQYDASDSPISGGGSLPIVKQIHIPTVDYFGDDKSASFLTLLNAFNDCPEGNVYLHYQVQAGSPVSQGGEGRKTSAPTAYTNTGASIATFKIDSIATLASGAHDIRVTYDSGAHAQIDMSYFWWTSEGCEITANDSAKSTNFVETTLSFAEKTNGWVSFKSWLQESGLSINGSYYTFDSGDIYEHEKNLTRNNFYGTQYNSTIDVLLNESPSAVKSFQTLKYSGSQARITQNRLTGADSDGNNQFDAQYYNNIGKTGWYVSSAETDLQSGKDLEFKPKEGKWFTTLQGAATYFNNATDTNVDEEEFSVQGIGLASSISIADGGGGNSGSDGDFTLTLKDDPSDH